MNEKRTMIILFLCFGIIIILLMTGGYLFLKNRMFYQMNRAEHLMNLKKYEAASEIYHDIAKNRRNRRYAPEALYKLGRIFEELAKRDYKHANREDYNEKAYHVYRDLASQYIGEPWAIKAEIRIADYHAREKKYDEAQNRLEDIKYGLERSHHHTPELWKRDLIGELNFELGIINFKRSRFSEAQKYFHKVVSSQKKIQELTEIYKARTDHRLGKTWKAIERYKDFENHHPTSRYQKDVQVAHIKQAYYQAMKAYRQRRTLSAITQFRDIVRRFPNEYLAENAQYWLAECYFDRKDYKRAVQELRKVRRNKKRHKDVDSLFKEALALYESKNYAAALKCFESLNEDYPKHRFRERVKQWIEMVKPDLSYVKDY